jgi:inosine-uridine nucleoside N-ribohydrolase
MVHGFALYLSAKKIWFMKRQFLCIFLFFSVASLAQQPVPVIFDTDIAPDYDDVGAITLLHALADRGEAKILATISSNAFETTAPTISVFNTYFNRPDIPVGITKTAEPSKACGQQWAQAIIQKYPHAIKTNQQAWDAVSLYRKILSFSPDTSVVVITVGFFTNLAHLMDSRPDQYSNLDGMQLIRKKVKRLVSMAARIDQPGASGYEFNVLVDAAASKRVFSDWPTPVILSGFEIGARILTGIRLIHNESITNSPVKDAFQIALTRDSNTLGRNSWDETAVLVAVRGISPYFSSRRLNLEVMDDGKDQVIPGEKFTWLTFSEPPEKLAILIEDLMMHQPVKAK